MWKKIKELLFRNVTTRQTVAKNTFWLAVSNIGGRLLRAVIIIYSARVLGAAEWGVFSYAITLIAFVAIFTDFGITPILIREAARFREDAKRQGEIISTSFFLKIGLLILGVIAIILIVPRITTIEGVKLILPIAIAIFIFDNIRQFCFSIIQATEKMEWEAGLYLLTNAGIVIFGFIFLYSSQTVLSLAYSYAFGTAIGMAATLFVLRKKFINLIRNFSPRIIKYIIYSAWPFAISGVLGILLTNTDILIIGWLRPAQDVGTYSAALRIVQLLYVLPAILATSILPVFSRVSQDIPKTRMLLERTLGVMFLAAIPIATGGFILGREIINFVFGNGYILAALSYQILMLTILVDFPATLLSNAAFVYNRQKILIAYAAIAGTLNVVFDLLLIPKFGITGSALATFSAQIISNIYLWHTVKKIIYFRALTYLKKIILSSLVMCAFALAAAALGINVIIVIAASAIIYFGFLFAAKEPLLKEAALILQPAASAVPANNEPTA